LDLHESAAQMTSRSVHPFLRRSPVCPNSQLVTRAVMDGFVQSWLPSGCLDPQESAVKRHLDWYSRFCTAHPCDKHTDRHTDHATCDVGSNRPHLMYCVLVMRPNNTSIYKAHKVSIQKTDTEA